MKHSKEVFKINLKGLKIAMKNLRASNQVVFAMNLCMPWFVQKGIYLMDVD